MEMLLAVFESIIPYGRHDISQDDIDSLVEILKSDFLTQGPTVPHFEKAVAQYCHSQYSVAVNSATSALHIACLALELGAEDWLWTSPNTFVASANCAVYCGAKVDFVDIDRRTYNMSVKCLREKLVQAEKVGRLPKIVVPIHFAGQPCDMRSIFELSQRYGFKIIEDASHAIGASYGPYFDKKGASGNAANSVEIRREPFEIKVGSCIHSHITVFSFHPVKIITTGEGGMALTNDVVLANRMSRLRSHGITTDANLMCSRPKNEIWNYQQIDLGFNYRMADINAALGLNQMKRLDKLIQERHKIAERYNKELTELPIVLPFQADGTYSSLHLYPIRINKSVCNKTQRQIYDGLWTKGVAANLHYIPVHRHPYYVKRGFNVGDFPEAEHFHQEAITIPMYPTLNSKKQSAVIEALSSLF